MKIAIPTHRRYAMIHRLTLSLLDGFDKKDIYIFISDPEDYKKYEPICPGYNLVLCNTDTATEKFNAIQNYFEGDEYIFVLEDDIAKVQSLMTNNLRKLFTFMEQYCRSKNIQACGVYPSSNKFFMSKSIEVGLTYLVANLFAFKANKDKNLHCRLRTKTDYERSIRYYNTLGKLARFNFVSCVTKNYTNKGGMQEMSDREGAEREASMALCQMFPDVFEINKKRKSQFVELKMRKDVTKEQL